MREGEKKQMMKLFSSQTSKHIWTKEAQKAFTKFIFSAKSISAVEIFIMLKFNFIIISPEIKYLNSYISHSITTVDVKSYEFTEESSIYYVHKK